MARVMVHHLRIKWKHCIVDFGCARGYCVRALRECRMEQSFGVDISEWAIDNGDANVRARLYLGNSMPFECDWVIAKDVLEHVDPLQTTINNLLDNARVGVFIVVPLAIESGGGYVCPEYERDVTHIHRLTLAEWVHMIAQPGWSVEARYRVPGIKDNWGHYERGNGFVTARRI